MKLRSLIIALAAVGVCALQASAQVTLFSQARSVSSSGCAGGQLFSAPDFNPFNMQASIDCGFGVGMGQSVQNSSLTASLITLAHQAQGGGIANTSSSFVVVFDVIQPVSYTFVATSDNATARVQFSGPGVSVDFTNSSRNDSGTLQPGRYTVTSNVTNPAPPAFAHATINLAFSSVPFTIPWFTIDGGGGSRSSGPFTLDGTIGQHDATPALAGGTFTLVGGFWSLPPACPGDVNGDRMVGLADIAAIINCWSQPASCNLAADLDSFPFIGLGDLAVVINYWGVICP